MNVLRAQFRELPPRERFWTAAAVVAAAALVGWWMAEWTGLVIGAALASRVLLGRPRDKLPRDADAERLERELQHQRDRRFELFRPGETRPSPPLDEEDARDRGDAHHLEKDLEHRRRAAARLLRGAPARPPAPSRAPARLFPPDPRPLSPAPERAELFKDAPPPPRPIVEEGGRLFRRARRSGKIVE